MNIKIINYKKKKYRINFFYLLLLIILIKNIDVLFIMLNIKNLSIYKLDLFTIELCLLYTSLCINDNFLKKLYFNFSSFNGVISCV